DAVHAVEFRGDLTQLLGADRGAEFVEFRGEGGAFGAARVRRALFQVPDAGVGGGAFAHLAREYDGRGGGAAEDRGEGTFDGQDRQIRVQGLREHRERATVVAGDHAEHDRPVEIDDGAADFGTVFELQFAHGFR